MKIAIVLLLLALPATIAGEGLYPSYGARLLAEVVCAECKGCPTEERISVAHVAKNRTLMPGWWGTDLVSVLKHPSQFAKPSPRCSWELPPRKDGIPWSLGMKVLHRRRLLEIRDEVVWVLNGELGDVTDGATYFHAKRLGRLWPHLREVQVPEDWFHRFYRRKEM